MKSKPMQWYRLRGYSVGQDGQTVDTLFISIVEAQSKHNVLKYYGGRRKCKTPDGTQDFVNFPRHEHEIERMPLDYKPTQELLTGPHYVSKNLVVQVKPATRYLCSCGKQHISEYPYPSMWCSCGQKAYPVPYVVPNEETSTTPFTPAAFSQPTPGPESSPLHGS